LGTQNSVNCASPALAEYLLKNKKMLQKVVETLRKSMKEKRESVNFPLSPYGARFGTFRFIEVRLLN
jgi:hypothetical protein